MKGKGVAEAQVIEGGRGGGDCEDSFIIRAMRRRRPY